MATNPRKPPNQRDSMGRNLPKHSHTMGNPEKKFPLPPRRFVRCQRFRAFHNKEGRRGCDPFSKLQENRKLNQKILNKKRD
jgi:hypothetical protein